MLADVREREKKSSVVPQYYFSCKILSRTSDSIYAASISCDPVKSCHNRQRNKTVVDCDTPFANSEIDSRP
jgi:hypothetical protein